MEYVATGGKQVHHYRDAHRVCQPRLLDRKMQDRKTGNKYGNRAEKQTERAARIDHHVKNTRETLVRNCNMSLAIFIARARNSDTRLTGLGVIRSCPLPPDRTAQQGDQMRRRHLPPRVWGARRGDKSPQRYPFASPAGHGRSARPPD